MKTKKLLILFLSLTSINLAGKTQTQATIDSLKVAYQSCLDKGDHMIDCTYRYYHQMDSLLNVVYKNRRSKLDADGKARLKAGQLKWLSQRDAYFKKLQKDLNTKTRAGALGKDEEMITRDQQADYVRERVEALIQKSAQ